MIIYSDAVKQIVKHVSTIDRVTLVVTNDEIGVSESIKNYILSAEYLKNRIDQIYVFHGQLPYNTKSLVNLNKGISKANFPIQDLNINTLIEAIDKRNESKESDNMLFMIYDFDYYCTTFGFSFYRLLENFILKYRERFVDVDDDVKRAISIRNLVFFSKTGKIPMELSDKIFKIEVPFPNNKEIEYLIKDFTLTQAKSVPKFDSIVGMSGSVNERWEKFKLLPSPQTSIKIERYQNQKKEEIAIPNANFSNLQDDYYLNRVIDQFKGLSQTQITKLLRLSIKENHLSSDSAYTATQPAGIIDVKFIAAKKIEINKVLIDELKADLTVDEIGGMGTIKRELPFIATKLNVKAKEYGIDVYKGMLLVGIPGTGKTTIARAIANSLQLPLLRLDVARLFGGIVGETEKNVSMVLSKLNAMAPNVVLIDEIEKAFSGTASSNMSDGGTMSRVFMSFLYWMQEKKDDVIIIATANNIEQIPPELTRAGRFDSIFFVELPTLKERIQLLNIFIKAKPKVKFSFDITRVATELKDFSGAEIYNIIDRCATQVVFNILNESMPRVVTEEMVLFERNNTSKIVELKKDDIAKLRAWAVKSNARLASDDKDSITLDLPMN